jgi:serine/threonine-protein kinase
MVQQPADRSLPQERLTTTTSRQSPTSWSYDGRSLAFHIGSGPVTGTWDIGILSLEGEEEPEYVVSTLFTECCAMFSPDSKWLAYVSDESGRTQVYVRPYPEPDVKFLISDEQEGGGEPVWSPDGTELFYRSGDKTMVVSIQIRGQTLTAGSPRLLFEGRYVRHSAPPGYQYYDVSPDGRFLMMKEGLAQEQAQINVIQNWFEELKRLVPTN